MTEDTPEIAGEKGGGVAKENPRCGEITGEKLPIPGGSKKRDGRGSSVRQAFARRPSCAPIKTTSELEVSRGPRRAKYRLGAPQGTIQSYLDSYAHPS